MQKSLTWSVSNFHDNMIALAADSIDNTLPEYRDISSVTVAIDQETFEEAKRRVQDFRRELNVLAFNRKKPDAVYQVNFQSFNLLRFLEEGMKRLLILPILLAFMACSSNGTEVGNPSGARRITGQLTTADQTPATLKMPLAYAVAESCPLANGDVSLILRDASGTETVVSVADDGSFEADIQTNQAYEIQFEQGDAVCGRMIYGSNLSQSGLRVTLGKGTNNIDFGDLDDQGDGVISTAIDPSQFCDNDSDGFTDDLDDYDDNDGRYDEDEDFDGYLDWFDDDDDGDGVSDDSDEDSSGGNGGTEFSCDIASVYPSETSGIVLDGDGTATVVIRMNSEVSTVTASEITILDNTALETVQTFGAQDIEVGGSGGTRMELEVLLSPDQDYVLSIAAGAIECENGEHNQDAIQIEFFTVSDDD